jgi:hypothetical protein
MAAPASSTMVEESKNCCARGCGKQPRHKFNEKEIAHLKANATAESASREECALFLKIRSHIVHAWYFNNIQREKQKKKQMNEAFDNPSFTNNMISTTRPVLNPTVYIQAVRVLKCFFPMKY